MKRIRRLLHVLADTPFHPQWLVFKDKRVSRDFVGAHASGLVLDVGCADKSISSALHAGCRYVGLDYYKTAREWYQTCPDIYGDAHRLPLGSNSIDTVMSLDVLEHLRDPEAALEEMARLLKPGGRLILQVPFLYPIHDAPLDFQRWTLYGLEALARRHGCRVSERKRLGRSMETAALMANLAASKAVLSWIKGRHPAAIAVIALPAYIVLSNLVAWFLSRLMPDDDMMPLGYLLLAVKE